MYNLQDIDKKINSLRKSLTDAITGSENLEELK